MIGIALLVKYVRGYMPKAKYRLHAKGKIQEHARMNLKAVNCL